MHLSTSEEHNKSLLSRTALCSCAQAMRTVEKNGLQATAKEAGLDLYSLPFTDARKARLEWLAQQPGHPPQSKVGAGRASGSVCCHIACARLVWGWPVLHLGYEALTIE